MKWFVPEALSDRAAAILEGPLGLCAPDLLLVEFANVLWKKTRRKEITHAEAREALGGLGALVKGGLETYPVGPLVEPALELAAATGATVYGATYLALAASLGIPLVTADRRFVALQRSGPLGGWVRSLDDQE